MVNQDHLESKARTVRMAKTAYLDPPDRQDPPAKTAKTVKMVKTDRTANPANRVNPAYQVIIYVCSAFSSHF